MQDHCAAPPMYAPVAAPPMYAPNAVPQYAPAPMYQQNYPVYPGQQPQIYNNGTSVQVM